MPHAHMVNVSGSALHVWFKLPEKAWQCSHGWMIAIRVSYLARQSRWPMDFVFSRRFTREELEAGGTYLGTVAYWEAEARARERGDL